METTMNNELVMYIGYLPRFRIDLNYVIRITFCKWSSHYWKGIVFFSSLVNTDNFYSFIVSK